MTDTVFLFSGQGSQTAGMGAELAETYREAAVVYEEAADSFGFDLIARSREADAQALAQTALSQPLIFTLSLAAFEVLRANGVVPAAAAGFSLGECAAMTAAGALTHSDGFKLIKARSAAMQRAADAADSAMYAVIGPDASHIDEVCFGTDGYVVPVNYNTPVQTVIAGEAGPAAAAADTLKNEGARVVKLAVGAAFHSRLMCGASEEFREAIREISFSAPAFPLYSNVTGRRLTEPPENYADYLKAQMTSPVRFVSELTEMQRDGFTRFVELGPGRTLCGFVRKTLKGTQTLNIEDKKTAETALAALREG